MMEEIKQDWLSLVDKAVYREKSATDSQVYLNPCERLTPGPMTLEKYECVISTVQCYATAVYAVVMCLCLSVSLSVSHLPV